MFSLSVPQPPRVWACCLISPWCSSKFTLASRHLLPPPFQCSPLPKTYRKRGTFEPQWLNGQRRKDNQTFSVRFDGVEHEKKEEKHPFKMGSYPSSSFSVAAVMICSVIGPRSPNRCIKPQGLCEAGPAGCWVKVSVAKSLCVRLISPQQSVGEEWRSDALLPSSLDTRVT